MMQNTRGEWAGIVKRLYGRKSLANYPHLVEAVRALGYPGFYKDATIVDAYPGTGVLSAALYNEIGPAKHVMFEPFKTYARFLRTLKTPNVVLSELDPYRWGSYTTMIETGQLPVSHQPWTQIHDGMFFTAALGHPQGEQLATQYLNCVSNRSWLQRYGRVRMLLFLKATTAEKMLAGPGERYRHRLAVQRESCCDVRVVFHTQTPKRKSPNPAPYPALLEKPLLQWDQKEDVAATKQVPMSLIELTPKEHQVELLDEFEYVSKNLFLLKSTPLSEAINNLGPGADEYVGPKVEDLLHKTPKELTLEEILRITRAFFEWPFKPEYLHDFYEESLMAE